jgi:hypothetical protein
MTWDAQRTREVTALVVREFIRFGWKIFCVKRTRSSSYVFAYHGKERLKIRVSDHAPNLRRRVPDLSIDPDSANLRNLTDLLVLWDRRFARRVRVKKKSPRGSHAR